MGDVREFTTDYGHRAVFIKMNSTSMNFEFKSNCLNDNTEKEAYIRLKRQPEHIYIKFSSSGCCLNDTLQTYSEDNFFPTYEFKGFWLSWGTATITLGKRGCFDKFLITYNIDEICDIECVSFGVNTKEMSVQWKLESPPVVKNQILKPIANGQLKWVSFKGVTKVIPHDCLVGGYENEILYIARAKHLGAPIPGKFVPSLGYTLVTWGEKARVKKMFEILCGYDCTWVHTSGNLIPLGAVVAGFSEKRTQENLYVGRGYYKGLLIPGKVQASHGVCYILINGAERALKDFEVLVVPSKYKAVDLLDGCFQNEDYLSDRDYDTLI